MAVKNPKYRKLLEKHEYLKGPVFGDGDERSQVPVHVVLGVNEYAAIKTTTGRTKLGWTVLLPGIGCLRAAITNNYVL